MNEGVLKFVEMATESSLPTTDDFAHHFATADYLDARYRPFDRRLGFPRTRSKRVWARWRKELREALRDTLTLEALGEVPVPALEVIRSKQCESYVRHEVEYETLPGSRVRAFLLIPDRGPARKPAVVCPHGHVPGASEGTVDPQQSLGAAYAHELAKRGVVTLSPDNAGNGARDVAPGEAVRGCDLLWRRLNHVGLDLTGFRVFELMAAVNLLERHPEVHPGRIGAAGLSGGCWLSQVLTALDDRIRAVVLSGYYSTFEQTAWVGHCLCHHPRGIGLLCDMPDLSALIAPRPLFVESGRQDLPYPVEPAFSITQEAYRLLDAEENLHLHRYVGGHKFHGKKSLPWLVSELCKL